MYGILRKESIRRVLPRLIVCALLAAVLLAVSGGGLLRLIAGPKALDAVPQTELSGQYVSFDASEVIVACATLSESGGSGTRTLKTYYLLPLGERQYIAVVDYKEHHGDVLEKAMEQSHEFYMGDLATLTPLGSLAGAVRPLEDGMADYMADCIDKYTLPGCEEGQDSANLILPWQVELDRAGLLTETWTKIFSAGAAVFLLLLIVQLSVVLAGGYQRRVRIMLEDTVSDAEFAEAKQVERVRVGSYVWYPRGPGSRVLKTADVVWGYAMPEPMVVSKYRWPVALYTREGTQIRLQFMEQKSCEEFLQAVQAQGNPFIKGYTSQYAEKFQQDLEGFLKDAQQGR